MRSEKAPIEYVKAPEQPEHQLRPNDEIIIRKYINYAEYAFYKAVEPSFEPEIANTSNVGDFANCSRKQLVNMFDKENFYNLTQEQKVQLCQAVVNDYCSSKGVASCEVQLGHLPTSDKTI